MSDRHVPEDLANSVMDCLHEFPHTSLDLSDELSRNKKRIQECLRLLSRRGLVERVGDRKRDVLWTLARTKRTS